MRRHPDCRTVEQLTARLSHECAITVSSEIAQAAASATNRAFGSRALTGRLEIRVTSYFEAVVRRRVLRRGGPADAAARLVIAAVVNDLTSAGRKAGDVIEELERGWSDKVPAHVLDEFRMSLCA